MICGRTIIVSILSIVLFMHADMTKRAQLHFQLENLDIFLRACEAYGVAHTSIFPTSSLFENKNMGHVVDCIMQFGTEVRMFVYNTF